MASDLSAVLALPLAQREREPEFLARAMRGDHEAYAKLVRPYERLAYRVAAAITGFNADAEEAMQNGFVKAYRSLHHFRVGAAFGPWLLKIRGRTDSADAVADDRRAGAHLFRSRQWHR
jgi:Sigma-70 region 2